MNIVITLAGHSRRFKQAGYSVPKAFIEIQGRPMIARVAEMFSPDDRFFFVMNTEQLREFPNAVEVLRSTVRRSEVIIVPPHEKGPVYSALQVKEIPDDEPLIVTYCDFLVDWDYPRFLRFCSSFDAAIPSFVGFHPASYGDTYYAYLRTEEERVLEIREKKSFTTDRTQEFASTGIYYFRSWEIFKKYGELLLEEKNSVLPEAYVSLVYNPMIRDGLDVGVYQVDRFICWGTPQDLEQYLFWSRYFQEQKLVSENSPLPMEGPRRVNLMPMAGRGTRFRQEGYRMAKPLIQVNNQPMALTAMHSFPSAHRWVCLVLQSELEKHPIQKAIERSIPDSVVIPVEYDTTGQAATCLLAEPQWKDDDQLFIASCDYQTIYDSKKWEQITSDPQIDGAVWIVRMGSMLYKNPNAFAYCKVAADGKTITEIAEKRTISDNPKNDPLVVGSFWYRRASDFSRGAKMMIDRGITVNGEHYVATSINTLLQEGKRFVIFEIDQWISFGDPFELRVFEYWKDHFELRQ